MISNQMTWSKLQPISVKVLSWMLLVLVSVGPGRLEATSLETARDGKKRPSQPVVQGRQCQLSQEDCAGLLSDLAAIGNLGLRCLAELLIEIPPSENPGFLELIVGKMAPPGLSKTMQDAALNRQILDPREIRYILANPEDFGSDWNLLRRRREILFGAPFLEEGDLLPDRDTVNGFLSFNRAFRQHLTNRQPLELAHWWELRAAIQETDALYCIWDSVRDARCDYYYVTARRQALRKLRGLIGIDAYNKSCPGPFVPEHRFCLIDP